MSRARAASAVGVGLVLTAVGGGLGIPHADVAGLHILSVVGLVVMATGLALLVVGTLSLVRSSHRFGRVGMLLGVVLAAYLLVPSIGLAVATTHVPRTGLGDASPADVGLEYSDVRFAARDGVRLSGWYVPSRNGSAVVLLHGAASNRVEVLDHAQVVAELGYGALLYDARGHGESGGHAMDLGWYGDHDVAGAVRFVRARPDVASGHVFAVGLAMGGEQALGALGELDDLCAVVAEGVTGRTAADKGWRSDAHGVRGFFQEGVDRFTYGLTDVLTAASPPRSLRGAVAAGAPRRALFIASSRAGDEPHAAEFVAEASPKSTTVWVAPGAAHARVLEARRAEWIQRVDDFLATAPASC